MSPPEALPTRQGRAWYAALRADALAAAAPSGYYEQLAARADDGGVHSAEHAVSIGVVQKDIGRTFPERPAFQSAAARTRLFHVDP